MAQPMGRVVLAGGHELRPGCEPMDRRVLREAGGRQARVVFLPTAVANYDPVGSGRGAVAYFARLGAPCEVAMILTRADADRPDMVAVIEQATLLYLGGGDTHVLLDALSGSLAWAAALRAQTGGAVVGGSSAGAMVACSHTLLPARPPAQGPPWVAGLGLVAQALVLPHFEPARAALAADLAARLAGEVDAAMAVLGIPEQSALLSHDGRWEVVGPGPVTVFQGGQRRAYASGANAVLGPG